MLNQRFKQFTTRLLTALLCLSIAATLLLAYLYYANQRNILDSARQHAQVEADRMTKIIDEALLKLETVNRQLTTEYQRGTLQKQDIKPRIIRAMEENPFLLGVGFAFVPYAYDPDIRLYSPLYVKRNGPPQMVQIEDSYDYTGPERDWYHLPLKQGAVWQEPHWGQASQSFLANFTAPFYAPDDDSNPLGVVFTSMSLKQYQELVKSLDLGDTGYGFILSKKGAFVAHPVDSYVLGEKTIFELAEEINDQNLRNLAQSITAGKAGHSDYQNELTGESAWVFYRPIPSSEWTMCVAFYNENLLETQALKEQFFRIGIMITVSLLLLFFLLIARKI